MKIAIDCADLDHDRIDGTRVYIKNLLKWFGKSSPADDFLLYHKKDFNPLLAPSKAANYIDRKIPYPWLWTQTRFAFELRADKPDVCLMPIQQFPFIGPKETKYVVTIHDLAFKYFPNHFPSSDRRKINFFTDTAVKRADKIIAISVSTKKDILKFYPKLQEDKVEVVHHGFEKEIFEKSYDKKENEKFLQKHGIAKSKGQHYLLYVGAIQPRKNLPTLIRAFNELRKEDKKLKLVLVGEVAWKAESTMETIESSPFKQDIMIMGKVKFDELAIFYREAQIFVFPPLYEGFGIPILEAFATGTPVVAAKNSSLVEVGGDAAEYFESENSQELFGKLQKILSNDILRQEMIAKGLQRAKLFSWERCARETLEIIRRTKN